MRNTKALVSFINTVGLENTRILKSDSYLMKELDNLYVVDNMDDCQATTIRLLDYLENYHGYTFKDRKEIVFYVMNDWSNPYC